MVTRYSWGKNERPFYHFTSIKACKEIITSGKIILTSCNSIKNVNVEVDALRLALERFFDESDDCAKNRYLKQCSANNISDIINLFIKDRSRTYVSCFTTFDNETEEIGNATYMWEHYADSYRGVVIKFNYLVFPYMKHGSSSISGQRNNECRIDYVIYGYDQFAQKIKRIIYSNHLFITDVYKPICCDKEKELRFLVHIYDKDKFYDLNQDQELFEMCCSDTIYYNFGMKARLENIGAIDKIFCKNYQTREELVNFLNGRDASDIDISLISSY